MLLRRVIEHVKTQNWTAVALDFVIVVVGVFIGIQVSNWNERLAERDTEARLLTYLAEDLRADMAAIERAGKSAEWRMSALDHVLREAAGTATPAVLYTETGSDAVREIAPFHMDPPYAINKAMTLTRLLDGNRTAYEAMVSTNGIEKITNHSLIRQIQQYYARVDLVNNFETRLISTREKVLDAQIAAGFSFEDTTPPERIIELLRNDPALMAVTKDYWSFTDAHRHLLADMASRADALLADIERERR
jgi:6-phosphofructokinase